MKLPASSTLFQISLLSICFLKQITLNHFFVSQNKKEKKIERVKEIFSLLMSLLFLLKICQRNHHLSVHVNNSFLTSIFLVLYSQLVIILDSFIQIFKYYIYREKNPNIYKYFKCVHFDLSSEVLELETLEFSPEILFMRHQISIKRSK